MSDLTLLGGSLALGAVIMIVAGIGVLLLFWFAG